MTKDKFEKENWGSFSVDQSKGKGVRRLCKARCDQMGGALLLKDLGRREGQVRWVGGEKASSWSWGGGGGGSLLHKNATS